jgi:hypothetical protein
LENLDDDDDDDVERSRARKSIRDIIKVSATDSLGYCELKQHKPWSDEKGSRLMD